jgi:hypothetical protein
MLLLLALILGIATAEQQHASPDHKVQAANMLLGNIFKTVEKNAPSLVMGMLGWVVMSFTKALGPKGVALFTVLLSGGGLLGLAWLHGQVCVGQTFDTTLEHVATFCAAGVLLGATQHQQQRMAARSVSAPSFFAPLLAALLTLNGVLKLLVILLVGGSVFFGLKNGADSLKVVGLLLLVIEALEWVGGPWSATVALALLSAFLVWDLKKPLTVRRADGTWATR